MLIENTSIPHILYDGRLLLDQMLRLFDSDEASIDSLFALIIPPSHSNAQLLIIDDADDLICSNAPMNRISATFFSFIHNSPLFILCTTSGIANLLPKYSSFFRRQSRLPQPNIDHRYDILSEFLAPYLKSESDLIARVCSHTPGYLPSDLYKLSRKAYTNMKLRGGDFLTIDDFHFDSVVLSHIFQAFVPKVSWSSIVGYPELKHRLQVLSSQWKLFTCNSSSKLIPFIPRGLLLHGLSGCGKTSLALAISGESSLNCIPITAGRLFQRHLGESERLVRLLFEEAKRLSPCIILLDQLDAIALNRSSESIDSGVQKRILSTLLNEMDGISSKQGVFVIATTCKLNDIDPAIIRPGRIDQIEHCKWDNTTEFRTKIFQNQLPDYQGSFEDLSSAAFAFKLPADLVKLCRRAKLVATMNHMSTISKEHFDVAINDLSNEQLQITSNSLSFI